MENAYIGFYDDVIDTDIPERQLRAMAAKNLTEGVILYKGRVIHAGRKCNVPFKAVGDTLYITADRGVLEVHTDTCDDDWDAMAFAVMTEFERWHRMLPSSSDDWEFDDWADKLEVELGGCEGLVIFNKEELYSVNGLRVHALEDYEEE